MIALLEPLSGKKSRLKLPAPQIVSRAEAEAVLHQIAVASNDKRKATADLDAELLAIKCKYQPTLADCDQRIDAAAERLADFASAHPEIFPKHRKSVEWTAGKLGFRTDTPSLVTLNRTFTWARVLAAITSKRWRKFIRVKTEVDKEAILSRCGTLEKPTKFQTKTLPALGLKIVQEEKFFVEPELTKTEGR